MRHLHLYVDYNRDSRTCDADREGGVDFLLVGKWTPAVVL